MLKRIAMSTLIALVLQLTTVAPAVAFANGPQRETRVEKVKSEIAKRAQKRSRVSVKLQDGSKFKGYIGEVGDDTFTLNDPKQSTTKTLNYADVTEVKGTGGLSLLAKIGIGVGIGVGVLAILYGIACHDDPIC